MAEIEYESMKVQRSLLYSVGLVIVKLAVPAHGRRFLRLSRRGGKQQKNRWNELHRSLLKIGKAFGNDKQVCLDASPLEHVAKGKHPPCLMIYADNDYLTFRIARSRPGQWH